jgi:hypothetical protein
MRLLEKERMSAYTVLKVSEPRKWTGTYGENEDFTLTLEGVDKPAILTQKPGKAPPAVGESIELELSPHPRFDDKLKAKRQQNNSFGGGFGSRPEDPARSARIQRMHAQEMAIRVIDLLHRAAALDVHALSQRNEFWDVLRDTTDRFDADVLAAASGAAGATSGGSTAPSDPSPSQLTRLKGLWTREKPNEQMQRALLARVGAPYVDPSVPGWSQALKPGQVSELIGVLTSGIVPTGGSDIPADAGEFAPPADANPDEFFEAAKS